MPSIEIKNVNDFVAAIEEFQDLIRQQAGKAGGQVTEMIKSKGVKVEKVASEPLDDGGFRITVDPGDIKKADELGVRETVAKSMFVMVRQRVASEFG